MDVRKPAKQMEMLWRGAKSFGDTADVFTSNFPTGACLLCPCSHDQSSALRRGVNAFKTPAKELFALFVAPSAFCPSWHAAAKQHNIILEQGKRNSAVNRVT